MKQVIEAGTDVASLCYFDSEALPEDFDERIKTAAAEEFDTRVREGELVC